MQHTTQATQINLILQLISQKAEISTFTTDKNYKPIFSFKLNDKYKYNYKMIWISKHDTDQM